ncbi:phosphatase PAP2 family protein [Archangium sp.]|uniref:phosphatase PAP2 family protein n=1 Tax=Archangium sp. TaxID=1872627 RepID=UPI00389B050B
MLGSVPTAPCFLAFAFLVASSPAFAEAPARAQQASDAPALHELNFSWPRDGIITGTGAVLWITSETLLKDELAPDHCRWCDRSADGTDTLNAVDRWGRGLAASTPEGQARWNKASNIADFIVLPVGVLGGQYLLSSGSGAPPRYFAEDTTIILESFVVSQVVNQVVKFSVGRERPFVHVLPEDQKPLTEHPTDNNLSFYSGHTAMAFSLVTAAGTVSELRGYKNRWLIWAVGLPVAASVGLMRMGADKHYLTDVLTGAVAGSLFGVGVPLLLHGRQGPAQTQATGMSMNVSGSLGGVMFSGRF